MILSMIREPSVNGATLSSLFFGAIFLCDVLEDEIREIVGRPVSEWKIKGRTAIPAGTYALSLVDSPRFGPETITLDDVPGYDYIRMHGGNKAEDTDGCLLPGSRNSDHTVAHSQDALRKVRELVVPHLRVGGSAYIEIVNPPGM